MKEDFYRKLTQDYRLSPYQVERIESLLENTKDLDKETAMAIIWENVSKAFGNAISVEVGFEWQQRRQGREEVDRILAEVNDLDRKLTPFQQRLLSAYNQTLLSAAIIDRTVDSLKTADEETATQVMRRVFLSRYGTDVYNASLREWKNRQHKEETTRRYQQIRDERICDKDETIKQRWRNFLTRLLEDFHLEPMQVAIIERMLGVLKTVDEKNAMKILRACFFDLHGEEISNIVCDEWKAERHDRLVNSIDLKHPLY